MGTSACVFEASWDCIARQVGLNHSHTHNCKSKTTVVYETSLNLQIFLFPSKKLLGSVFHSQQFDNSLLPEQLP